MIQLQFQTFDGLYLQQLRSGDCRTEEHFVAYFNRFLQLKLYKCLRSRPAMEDVRQETFARVWIALRKEEGIRRPERLGAFVNSVCNNVLREYYRAACKQAPSEDDADNIPDPAAGAAESLASRQVQWTVDRILAELPRKDRDLLRAVFLEERDKNEVCRKFGVDREYLRVLLHRAKRRFRSLYLERVDSSPRFIPGIRRPAVASRPDPRPKPAAVCNADVPNPAALTPHTFAPLRARPMSAPCQASSLT